MYIPETGNMPIKHDKLYVLLLTWIYRQCIGIGSGKREGVQELGSGRYGTWRMANGTGPTGDVWTTRTISGSEGGGLVPTVGNVPAYGVSMGRGRGYRRESGQTILFGMYNTRNGWNRVL